MTTKTVFSIKDPDTSQDEKIASRIISLQSVFKQQQDEIGDINKMIKNLDSTFENLEYLYNRLTRSLNAIKWAAKEMIVIMNVLSMTPTTNKTVNDYGGYNTNVWYPDRWVWKNVYPKYAPYIPGGLY